MAKKRVFICNDNDDDDGEKLVKITLLLWFELKKNKCSMVPFFDPYFLYMHVIIYLIDWFKEKKNSLSLTHDDSIICV